MNIGERALASCDPRIVAWMRSRLVPWRRQCQLETEEMLHASNQSFGYLHEVDFHAHMRAAGFEKIAPRSPTSRYRARWLGVPATCSIAEGEALARVVTSPSTRVTAAELFAVSQAMRAGYITTRRGRWLWTRYTRAAGIPTLSLDRGFVVAYAAPGRFFTPSAVQAAFTHPRHRARLVRADEERILFRGVPKDEGVLLLQELAQLTRPRLRLVCGGT